MLGKKVLTSVALCLLAILSLAAASTSESSLQTTAQENLFQVLLRLNATTFVSLINSTDLSSLLLSPANHTVFAPTNEAIAQAKFLVNATQERLKEVLLYHFANGVTMSKDLSNGELIPSLMALSSLSNNTQQLQISIASRANQTLVVKVNNARIIAADFSASNGVAHLISSVIVPPSLVFDVATATPSLSTLTAAVKIAKLESAVNADSVTVFAPTNDAFGAALTGYLLLPNSSSLLTEVLAYHVVPNKVVYASMIQQGKQDLPTDAKQNIVVDRSGDNVTINGVARVTEANVLAANGVVHLISAVLLPAGFEFNLEKALLGLNASILLDQIKRAGLEWLVANVTANSSYTIFAPTNSAFQTTNAGIDKYSVAKVLGILKTHVVAGSIDQLTKGQEFTNLNGEVLVVGDDGASVQIKGDGNVIAKVIGGANAADNGVVYSIDKVIHKGSDDDDSIPEIVVIIVLAVCVPFLLALLGLVLLWDLRNWLKRRQALSYSPISGDEYEN